VEHASVGNLKYLGELGQATDEISFVTWFFLTYKRTSRCCSWAALSDIVISMPDIQTLQMALIGYQAERRKINERIVELEARLQGRAAAPLAAAARPRRQMSAAAKARIAAAQRRRWAQFRKEHAAKNAPARAAGAKSARKRVSPETRRKRIAALAKARAARAAKRSASKAATAGSAAS
jgi:hypothetical protein